MITEITMNVKPGRKRKANTAKTLVEIHGLKSANNVKWGNLFNIIGQGESKKLLFIGSVSRRSGDPLFGGSRDRGETRQFKADRFHKRATHHSNF